MVLVWCLGTRISQYKSVMYLREGEDCACEYLCICIYEYLILKPVTIHIISSHRTYVHCVILILFCT